MTTRENATGELDFLWEKLRGESNRESFRFNPDFRFAQHRDLRDPAKHPEDDNLQDDEDGGRFANLYQWFVSKEPPIRFRKVLSELVSDHDLRDALARGVEGAHELAFELLALGAPVDQTVSNFSCDHYLAVHRDVSRAGVHPLVHYLRNGHLEARRTLKELRGRIVAGEKSFDPDLPSIVLCLHELAASGAPYAGLQIARDAAGSHNVVVLTGKGGPLSEEFRKVCSDLIESREPLAEWPYIDVPYWKSFDFAIVNSVEAFAFLPPLVAHQIPICAYIHEFSDDTFPVEKMNNVASFADKIVFSSDTVRKTWDGVLSDCGVDAGRDVAVVPPMALKFAPLPSQVCLRARAELSRLIGVECGDRRIVYGAGYPSIRKGTDLFVMAAQQMKEIDPDAVFVWFGDTNNHQDMSFGIWLEKHKRSAGANLKGGNLYFLPAGRHYLELCRAADVHLLTSRLDPLPNSVFDAAAQGCSTVLFHEATGFDDLIYRDEACVVSVPFGNVSAALQAIGRVPSKLLSDRYGKLASAKPTTTSGPFQRILSFVDFSREPLEPLPDAGDPLGPSILFPQEEDFELRAREGARRVRLGRVRV